MGYAYVDLIWQVIQLTECSLALVRYIQLQQRMGSLLLPHGICGRRCNLWYRCV